MCWEQGTPVPVGGWALLVPGGGRGCARFARPACTTPATVMPRGMALGCRPCRSACGSTASWMPSRKTSSRISGAACVGDAIGPGRLPGASFGTCTTSHSPETSSPPPFLRTLLQSHSPGASLAAGHPADWPAPGRSWNGQRWAWTSRWPTTPSVATCRMACCWFGLQPIGGRSTRGRCRPRLPTARRSKTGCGPGIARCRAFPSRCVRWNRLRGRWALGGAAGTGGHAAVLWQRLCFCVSAGGECRRSDQQRPPCLGGVL